MLIFAGFCDFFCDFFERSLAFAGSLVTVWILCTFMGKKANKSKRGEVNDTDFRTPKNGSKRRQNFSPSGLTPEEKTSKPGSTGPNGPGVNPLPLFQRVPR